MITGISFGRGVFFHDRHVLACAEVKRGIIHVWAEKITLRTIGKLWLRIVFSLPWYYHVMHAALFLYLLFPIFGQVDPLWAVVYLAGFHFVFPRRLKQFHGAEHKVFSYSGEKKLEALDEIRRASIVNSGCSTNYVTYFFTCFLAAFLFLPLEWSVFAGAAGIAAGWIGEKYARRYLSPFHRISAFLQKHVTTQEPDRIHLETAIRSYRLFQHYQEKGVN
jgi:hypothetical protein